MASRRQLLCPIVLLLFACLALQRQILAILAHAPHPPTACEVRDSLAHAANQSHAEPDDVDSTKTAVVRLYWWFRFQGARRATGPKALRGDYTCAEHGLRCILDSTDAAFASAHAVIVWVGARPDRECLPPQLPDHTWVVEFSESPAYYSELRDEAFMSRFSLKVSTEIDSDVMLTAVHPLVEGGVVPPAHWLHAPAGASPKLAIVWMAKNCESRNKRELLVTSLRAALPASLPLHSLGECLHTHDAPSLAPKTGAWAPDASDDALRSKLTTLGSYTFCLVLENSIAADYVTEKLFHAFAAGCYPIYYGTRDVSRVLPHAQAAVQVLDYRSVPALVTALQELAARPAELQARQAWRDDPAAVERWWQTLRNRTAAQRTATKPQHFCSICDAVRKARRRGGGASSSTHHRLRPSRRPPEDAWEALV